MRIFGRCIAQKFKNFSGVAQFQQNPLNLLIANLLVMCFLFSHCVDELYRNY